MSECACGRNWRIEVADLRTGIVQAVLHPTAFDFQKGLIEWGQGSLTLATKDVRVRDIWPHKTAIFFARTAGGSATVENPVCEWAGMVEKFAASDGGTTSVGMVGIESYLNHRIIAGGMHFVGQDFNVIGRDLAAIGGDADGIPLVTVAGAPYSGGRDRHYESWDFKNVGEAVEELANVINGPEWEVSYQRVGPAWQTTMMFRQRVGADREITLKSDREALGYSMEVDAKEHATKVWGIGAGEEEAMLTTTSEDGTGFYPRFEAAPAWKDVSVEETLQEHTDGYVEDHKEPLAIPSVTLRGLDPDPNTLRLGDGANVDVNYGAVTYRGPARVTGIAWAVGVGEPETRTLDLQPTTRASESVWGQHGTDDCPDC